MNRSLALPALLLAALVLPATAAAATRCVPAAGPGCDTSHATIAAAVTAAADGDTIAIAAGVYAESVSTTKRLNFLGAGGGTLESAAGATVIAPVGGTALSLSSGGSVRAIRALGSTGTSGASAITFAPSVNGSYSLDLTGVVAIGGNATDFILGFAGPGLTAYSVDAAKVLTTNVVDSQFRAGSTAGIIEASAVQLSGAGQAATVSRSRIVGVEDSSMPALVASATNLTLEDSTVIGPLAAQLSDGDYAIRRSRLLGSPSGTSYGVPLTVLDTSTSQPQLKLRLEDSLVVAEPTFDGIEAYALQATAYTNGHPFALEVSGSTLIARGSDPDGAVGLLSQGASPSTASIDLRNTVARIEGTAESGEADLVAKHGAITAASSAFSSAATAGSGTTTVPGSGSNLPGDPQLDAGFAPAAGSRLIDRGDPAFAYSGELDVDANARSQDGNGDCVARPDIGAFELAWRCPAKVAAPDVAPAISQVSLSRKRFTMRRPVHKGRKRGATLRFTLSEAAAVTVAIERKAKGRRVKVNGKRRCVKPTKRNAGKARCPRYVKARTLRRAGKVGANELKLGGRPLTPGAYRLTLTATDPAGKRSKPRQLGFTVLRP